MQSASSPRALFPAVLTASVLWLPLLAPDLGYPSVVQTLTVPAVGRTALVAAAIALAIVLAVSLAAAVGARRPARRSGGAHAGLAAFCGAASGSATMVLAVVAFSAFAGDLAAGRTVMELGLALLVASVAAALFAALAGFAGGRSWGRAVAWGLAVLALVLWAFLTTGLVRATEAAGLGLSPWPLAAAALAVGLALSWRGIGRMLAASAAVILVLLGSWPAMSLLPPRPPAGPDGEAARASRGAPHVVMVVIDTWRWDATDLAREGLGTTPRLAELAAGGTVFREAVAPAPSTLPSVKAMITGRFASHHGIPWWGKRPPPEDAWTLARAFRSVGYTTSGFTSNALIQKEGFEAGFESFWAVGGLNNVRHSFYLFGLAARGDYWRLVPFTNALGAHKVRGDSVVGRFVDWLDHRPERRPPQPFFAYVHVVEPHFPYHDRGYGLVPEEVRDLPETYTHHQLMRLPKGDPGNVSYREAPAMREMLGRYHEEVRDADRLLGEVIDALTERGLFENTVLVVVGDHGEEFLEHHGFGHGHDVYDELVRVPLVIRWPQREPFTSLAASVEMPVSLLDVFPTLTDILELPIGPRPFAGRSLLPVLRGEDRPRGVASEMVFGERAHLTWRFGRYKARIVFDAREMPSASQDVEVYDVVADPGETMPLAVEGEVAEFLDEARRQLDALWSESRDATLRVLSPEDAKPAEDEEEDPEIRRLKSLGYL